MIELEYVKKHLHIESDDEDEVLESFIESAEEIICTYCNRTWNDFYNDYGKIPSSIKNAVSMIVGSLYRDREGTSRVDIRVNPVLKAMVRPFKKISV